MTGKINGEVGFPIPGGRRASEKRPIGIQTFREFREGNHYHVDKTGFAWRLIEEDMRPFSLTGATRDQ